MYQSILPTNTTQSARNFAHRSPWRPDLLLIPLALVCFTFLPPAQGVTPGPDGGYGGNSTAEGTDALFSLTTGVWNSAFGFRSLYKDATGIRNTAVGYQALYNNNGTFDVSGQDNVAVGANALFNNTSGKSNIAIGSFALYGNTTGSNNIAIGDRAFWKNVTGSGNTQIGDSFSSSPGTVLIGRPPTVAEPHCDMTDPGTLSTSLYGHDDVYVGMAFDFCPFPKTLRVHLVAQDAVYADAVYGNPIAGSPVSIDSNGQLGVATSSKRFKTDIEPMDKASEAILALKPVTFYYKKEIDPKKTAQFGLVAEEVEKVNADLVTRDAKGELCTVRYEAVNSMLLNEFLKEHRKVEEQAARMENHDQKAQKLEATVTEQQKEIAALSAILTEQTAQIRKVSDQLELSKSAPNMVVHNQ